MNLCRLCRGEKPPGTHLFCVLCGELWLTSAECRRADAALSIPAQDTALADFIRRVQAEKLNGNNRT